MGYVAKTSFIGAEKIKERETRKTRVREKQKFIPKDQRERLFSSIKT